MTLVTQFLAVRRDRLLMRLGCWLVCFSLIVGLMLPQQRAYALEPLTITAVASVAAAYLGACGLSIVVSGMDKDALVSSVQRLINEFLSTQLGGVSIQDWLGAIWSPVVMAGKLILGRPLTNELMGFAQWVAQKYAAQVGENVVFGGGSVSLEVDGSLQSFSFTTYSGLNGSNMTKNYSLGTVIPVGSSASDPVILRVPGTNYSFRTYWEGARFYVSLLRGDSSIRHFSLPSSDGSLIRYQADTLTFTVNSDGHLAAGAYDVYYASYFIVGVPFVEVPFGESSLSIDREENPVYIPDGITAEQGIALDVGAAATMGFDQVVQGVLEGVLSGTLESTMEIAGDIDVPVDPPAGEITDVDDLGLPALGQALTSRFPFSIPWDFMRAVQLLAAPAKAPYFEVDFLKPIEHRVGQWQGSTTVVLDFEQYAIIGQVSRWTSTIGFCLMLASATKRLIWTA